MCGDVWFAVCVHVCDAVRLMGALMCVLLCVFMCVFVCAVLVGVMGGVLCVLRIVVVLFRV